MNNYTPKKFLGLRLGALLLLIMVVATALIGCAGGVQSAYSEDELNKIKDTITFEEGKNSLTESNMEDIAVYLANNPAAKEAFIAAYRGYDMTDEATKKGELDDYTAKDPSIEFAAKILRSETFKSTGDLLHADKYAAINEADMLTIIDALRQTVTTEESRGFFGSIQYGIGVALKAITDTVGFHHYLIGICIFAIVVEILMLPFGIKQQKNSIKQATLRPKEMAIRKKYAGRNDQPTQQKMMQEIQEMYQREGFNPMGGCLPLLIQFPIIIILYNIVVDPICYMLGFSSGASSAITTFCTTAKAAGGLGYGGDNRGTIGALSHLKDMLVNGSEAVIEKLQNFLYFSEGNKLPEMISEIEGEIPSFNVGGLNFGLIPSFSNWLWFIPVITFFVYFFSMKLTRKMTYQATTANDPQMGCSNKIMDFSMPLMSVYIAFITPAIVGVYWLFKSILGTLKQFILTRMMPLPKFTEEDYKAAEKEMRGKGGRGGSQRNYTPSGDRPRSLHYIDADDDDEEPAPRPRHRKHVEEDDEKPAPAGNSLVEKAPLKDDSKDNATEEKTEETTNDNE